MKIIKFIPKFIGVILFIFLFILNIQITSGNKGSNILGYKINFIHDLFAARQNNNGGAGSGGGNGGNGNNNKYCSTSTTCTNSTYGIFNLYCTALGYSIECNQYNGVAVECRAWDQNGHLISYTYRFCP